MKRASPNRRVFITQSASVAAAGAALATSAQAATIHPEIERWKAELGSRFQVGDKSLLLRRVDVTDYSTDRARPRHLRPHSIALNFVCDNGTTTDSDQPALYLEHRSQEIHLTRIIPPERQSGEFYEGVIN